MGRYSEKPAAVISHPTKCLHCTIIVNLELNESETAWNCPRCGHEYLVKHWKIRRMLRSRDKGAS